MGTFLSSPRRRRRLAWTLGPLLVAAVVAATVWQFSDPKRPPPANFRPGDPVAREAPDVPFTQQMRVGINRTLDEFLPAALGRTEPIRAWPLAGPGLRAGTTRRDWAVGNLPVHPYPFGSRPFRDWRPVYAKQDRVAIDLLLLPRPGAQVGAIVFGIDLVRGGKRWLVDSMYPAQTWNAPGEGPGTTRAVDFTPAGQAMRRDDAPTAVDEAKLHPAWFAVPAAIFGLALALPLVLGIRSVIANRRAAAAHARWNADRGRAAPPPG